jgi:hypothetical protein
MHPQALFNIGFFVYFLLLPLALWSGVLRFAERRVAIPRVSPDLLVVFWVTIGLTIVMSLSLSAVGVRRHYVQELREMYYAAFICLHIVLFASPRLLPDTWINNRERFNRQSD